MMTARVPTSAVHTKLEVFLETFMVVVTGLLLGIFPEAGLVGVCVCGVWGLWRFRWGFVPARDLLILAFAAVRLAYAVRSSTSIWVALIEAVVILLLPRAAWILRSQWRKVFGICLVLGLCVPIAFAVFNAWTISTDSWLNDPTRATVQRLGDDWKLTAVHPDSAAVVQVLGPQGPGQVEYQLEVRADRPQRVILSFQHPGLQPGPAEVTCMANTVWQTCRVSANLARADVLKLVIGGAWTWRKGSPDIEIRSPQFRVAAPSSLLNRVRFAGRQAGFSFNPNMFGAAVTVISLIALCGLRGFGRIPAVLLLVVGSYLSGSRGAMFAAAISLLAFVLLQSRWLKLVIPVLLACSLFVVATQINSNRTVTSGSASISPGFRAFRLDGFDDALSRLDIWRDSIARSISAPVFGFDPRHREQIQSARDADRDAKTVLPAHSHNLWLEMMAEGGLLQLSLLAGLMAFVVFRLVQSQNLIWLTPLIGILFINISDFIFYYAPIRVCLGLLLGLEGFVKRPNPG
jgi:O-Antigen ligase